MTAAKQGHSSVVKIRQEPCWKPNSGKVEDGRPARRALACAFGRDARPPLHSLCVLREFAVKSFRRKAARILPSGKMPVRAGGLL